MEMIPEFQKLPLHICLKIFKMVPRPAYIYQLINMRECLEDYKEGSRGIASLKWKNMAYMDFALHKIRQKKNPNIYYSLF